MDYSKTLLALGKLARIMPNLPASLMHNTSMYQIMMALHAEMLFLQIRNGLHDLNISNRGTLKINDSKRRE